MPLDSERGGPLVVNHLHLRKLVEVPGRREKELCGVSYLLGRVAAKGEGMLGHHVAETGDGVPRTLILGDESSGIEDLVYERAQTWARRALYIGNPFDGPPGCSFFKRCVKEGDKSM